MRIIAGEFRGRKLLPPRGQQTRPITDRVKQSLFDILSPRIEGAVVYDCFAGTGSMGLECISRGASQVVFFERDRSAAQRLKENIKTMQVDDRATIVASDLFKWFAQSQAGQADLVFLDPPYRFLTEEHEKLRSLSAHLIHHLNDDAIVVFRQDARDQLELPELTPYDQRTYGGMTLEFLRRSNV
jgi:16S rRNA (guanine966-N2)-methyltransferase